MTEFIRSYLRLIESFNRAVSSKEEIKIDTSECWYNPQTAEKLVSVPIIDDSISSTVQKLSEATETLFVDDDPFFLFSFDSLVVFAAGNLHGYTRMLSYDFKAIHNSISSYAPVPIDELKHSLDYDTISALLEPAYRGEGGPEDTGPFVGKTFFGDTTLYKLTVALIEQGRFSNQDAVGSLLITVKQATQNVKSLLNEYAVQSVFSD